MTSLHINVNLDGNWDKFLFSRGNCTEVGNKSGRDFALVEAGSHKDVDVE